MSCCSVGLAVPTAVVISLIRSLSSPAGLAVPAMICAGVALVAFGSHVGWTSGLVNAVPVAGVLRLTGRLLSTPERVVPKRLVAVEPVSVLCDSGVVGSVPSTSVPVRSTVEVPRTGSWVLVSVPIIWNTGVTTALTPPTVSRPLGEDRVIAEEGIGVALHW